MAVKRRSPRSARKPRPKPRPHGGTAGLPHRPQWPWPAKPPRRPPLDRRSLAAFLRRHPTLADAIVWRAPGPVAAVNGVPTPYSQWSGQQKKDLSDAWVRIRTGSYPGLSATPKVGLVLDNGEVFSTTLPPATAWRYYIGYVAQSLAIEADRAVPWSLDDYSPSQLVWLLDSKSLFHYSSGLQRYGTPRQHTSLESLGAAQPGDPVRTFRFLDGHGLIGADRRETVERALEWCRTNLVHFYGRWTPDVHRDHWGYRGWPPVERILAGTTHPQFGFAHWTAGCWGTAGFLRAVLRTVNIPSSIEMRDGHALPRFHRASGSGSGAGDLYLSHGDDPYNSLWRATPRVPIADLPITAAEFGAWFGPGVSPPPGGSNVGRQTVELSIEYLSDPLLRYHCEDLADGRGHGQSRVFGSAFAGLSRFYSVLELEAQGLWTRLDAKLALIGGCANVPP